MQVFFTFLLLPLMVLNFFGGLISGVWLAFLGDWWAIAAGIAGLFLSTVFLGVALLPGMIFTAPAILLADKGKYLLASPLILLSNLYIIALITGWCLFVFWYFMSRATHQDFLPLLLWSYGSALGPWMYVIRRAARAGADNLGERISVFSAQVAYIVIALVVIFARATLLDLFFLFGAIMTLGLFVQLTFAFLVFRERHRTRMM